MAIFKRGPLQRSVECRWGRQTSRFWVNIWLNRMLWTLRPPGVILPPDRRSKLWHLSLVVKRRSLLIAGEDDEMFMTKSLNITPKTAHLTARSDKSVAYVTNNKRLYSAFCTVEANYWQIRGIARPLCDSRATCYSKIYRRSHHWETWEFASNCVLTVAGSNAGIDVSRSLSNAATSCEFSKYTVFRKKTATFVFLHNS